MTPKLKDIANRAQVSTAAVSLALNNKSGVSKETAERIQKIARDLNYSIPRGKLESLETVRFIQINKPDQIIDPLHKGFIADYLKGLTRAAKASGYKLEVVTFSGRTMDEAVMSFEEDSPAGAVILGAGLWPEDVRRFEGVSTPLAFIDVCYDFLPFDFVDMNNADSVFQIISHLVEMGHSRIGIVQSSDETPNFTMREEAFLKILAFKGLSFDPNHRYVLSKDAENESPEFERRLAKDKDLPTALFCVNDTIAHRAVQILRGRGIRVPEDLSIVGFDNLPSSEYMDPPLTTIDIRKDLMGERAFYLLMERMRLGMDKPAEKIKIDGTLVRRASVAAPARS